MKTRKKWILLLLAAAALVVVVHDPLVRSYRLARVVLTSSDPALMLGTLILAATTVDVTSAENVKMVRDFSQETGPYRILHFRPRGQGNLRHRLRTISDFSVPKASLTRRKGQGRLGRRAAGATPVRKSGRSAKGFSASVKNLVDQAVFFRLCCAEIEVALDVRGNLVTRLIGGVDQDSGD